MSSFDNGKSFISWANFELRSVSEGNGSHLITRFVMAVRPRSYVTCMNVQMCACDSCAEHKAVVLLKAFLFLSDSLFFLLA